MPDRQPKFISPSLSPFQTQESVEVAETLIRLGVSGDLTVVVVAVQSLSCV